MMLAPSMKDLLTHIDNRYMLVNIAAKRARDIAINAEEKEISLSEKKASSPTVPCPHCGRRWYATAADCPG